MNYQQMVDEMRSFLQFSDMTQTDRLKELADAYTEACRAVNQRLRRCDEFLKKGLRSEAIQFAEAEPALLEAVSTLDFPERKNFQEIMNFYSLKELPRLLLEIAEDLNQAYAEERPLEELLRTHRRLALLRAPVAGRLKVMKRIAQVDKNNLVWSDDIQTFELARIREIQAEMAGTAKGNMPRVAALAQELEQRDWLTPLPRALVDQVRAESDRLTQIQTRNELEKVVGALIVAMNVEDVARARGLRKEYLTLLKGMQMMANDRIFRQAAGPLEWLAETEQALARDLEFQNAVAEIEDALDQEVDVEEVSRLYHAALDLEFGLPRPVEQRYRAYVSRADSSRRWRERLILLSVLLGGMLLLLVVFGFLWLNSRNHTPLP